MHLVKIVVKRSLVSQWTWPGKSSQRPVDSWLSARWSDYGLARVVGFVGAMGPTKDMSVVRKFKVEEEKRGK